MSIGVDMLRAFVTLADTLNLSVTAQSLSTTRQTVRRHIDLLGEIKGGPLFALSGRSYVMTDLGRASLEGARLLLAQFEEWADKRVSRSQRARSLEYAEFVDEQGRQFVSRQHPVSHVSKLGTPRIRKCLAGWGAASAGIAAEGFDTVRNEVVIYRRSQGGWICVSVGNRSAYAEWFGKEWAESAIGRMVYEDNAGDEINRFVFKAYERVYDRGGIRYDHLSAHLPKPDQKQPVEVTFQRLLLGCVFPDGAPALAVVVDITGDVDLSA